KSVRFAFLKDGVYYFSRRVPSDLRSHYATDRISFSLRTKSARDAEARGLAHAIKLDEFWFKLRMNGGQVPGHHRLLNEEERSRRPSPTMVEAKELYLRLKGVGRPKTFYMGAERAVEYLITASGNKALLAYTKSDATAFRDALYARKLGTSSVERVMTTIKAIVAFALSEEGITAPNPFVGVYLNRQERAEDRKPISLPDIRSVQAKCRELDDDVRWLVALISDTGMRLAEAAGLLVSDFSLDDPVPHVVVQPHPWRSLKTTASERCVPLVGEALWAASRIVKRSGPEFAFPRYNRADRTNANSASASLNKWLGKYVPAGCVVHSFRHSLRDRLRAVECPSDVVDQIGGWTTAGNGQGYGQGYPLSVKHRWMAAASEYISAEHGATK
ncbi:integrase, partial [Devosia subaequoris]|nr:integrase [Devosia subaequoris]